jgi:predicted dehydrogenase
VSVRFGLLGTGFWADTIHAPGLAAHPDVELVGVWGRDASRAGAVAARHGAAAVGELDELVAEVDAVSIAVAPDVQPALAVRAAQAGCHLLLEKPMALGTAAGECVLAAATDGQVASLVFFTSRFVPASAAWMRETADAGDWDGGSVSILASISEEGNPYGRSRWRKERGALWDVGPHALGALLPVLGPVAKVVGVRGHGDTAQLALSHAGGAASTVTLSLTAPPAAARSETTFWGRHGVTRMPAGGGLDSVSEGYAAAVSELVRLIGAGEVEHPCDARFGLEVTRVLAAAERCLEA